MIASCKAINHRSAALPSLLLVVWLASPLITGGAPRAEGLAQTSQPGAPAIRGLGNSLQLRFPAANAVQTLGEPNLQRREGQRLLMAYETESPDKVPLWIERRMERKADHEGVALCETFSLSAARPLTNDIEIEIPFVVPVGSGVSATCPLKNGWARSFPLSAEATCVEYRLGSFITGKETPELALPLVQVQGQGRAAAIFADPMFSTLFSLRSGTGQIEGTLRFRYAASKVPLSAPETRQFAIWVPSHEHRCERDGPLSQEL